MATPPVSIRPSGGFPKKVIGIIPLTCYDVNMKVKQRSSRDAAGAQALAFERPLSTVDVVIFAVRDGALHVLLVRRPDEPSDPFPGLWALPGGFVDVARDKDLEACALRKLREKTGVA